jgi:hypothetical protein
VIVAAMAVTSDGHAITMGRHPCTAGRRMTSNTGTRASTLRRQQRRSHKYQGRSEYL